MFPSLSPSRSLISNSRGQGLIEYLIIVALIAVTTIGVMRVVGQNITAKLASVSAALHGENTRHSLERVDESLLKKRDLGDFMNGVGDTRGAK